jgi:DNA ligase-1
MKLSFPVLFQKTQTSAIQEWKIWVTDSTIHVEFGHIDGKKQYLKETITTGKNLNKKNSTSAEEQAANEAQSRWLKQKKKGYVENIDDAVSDKVDDTVILGGYAPMLAPNKSFPKDDELEKRIEFPCYVQPKLDGMRCIAVIDNGKCTLWSRTRKPIKTVPHIVAELEARFPGGIVVLDGELYNHDYRNSFEDLISILRKDAPDAEGLYKVMQYHVYDCIDISTENHVVTETTPFKSRFAALIDIIPRRTSTHILPSDDDIVQLVRTHRVQDLETLVKFYDNFLDQEYEGAMARNSAAPYECDKRSKNLQKMKPFQDDEFKIVGVNEGRGKDAGTAGTFTCVTSEGKEFYPRLKGTYAYRRELLEKPELWKGKQLTVTYKRMTSDNIPYLPIGKAIRDYQG